MMRTRLRTRAVTAFLAALVGAAACGGNPATPSPAPSPTPAPTPPTPQPASIDVTIAGDPEAAAGATWTCRGTVDGMAVDLQGILLKPAGAGPFPAVVISHGGGGNAHQYSLGLGQEMRGWGLVAIGTNYTHAAGVPLGSPGTGADQGASAANVVRAHATVAILARLGYVDVGRLAAHGHSMGAFVTTAFVAAHGAELRVASHTSGGTRIATVAGAAPTDAQAAAIRTPYQWHHGDADNVVPLSMDQRLDAALATGGAPREGHVYAGQGHDIATHADVLTRVRAWYRAHGLI